MTQPDPNEPPVAPLPVPSAPRSRSCAGRIVSFVGWLFTLILAAGLALVAAGGILLLLGVDLTTPQQIRQASSEVQRLQAAATAQADAIVRLQTAQAQASIDLNNAREQIDELEAQTGQLAAAATAQVSQAATAVALGRALQTAVAEAAMLQDQLREGQVAVAVVATIQAEQNERIRDIERRSERLTRFLDRLSDIAADTVDDVGLPTPTAPPAATSALPAATPTATPAPSGTSTPTP